MIGTASAPAVDHRMRSAAVLALLLAVAVHLLGCLHGPAGDGPHLRTDPAPPPLSAGPLPVLPADAGLPMDRVERGEHCPDGLDHAVDRVRADAQAAPPAARTPLAYAEPDAGVAAARGTAALASAGDVGSDGKGVLAVTCVART
ncbi:hypothetical protein [Streptomyces sp. NPDC058279]|uniref:hypothetical protein n=1 Tax=Streptomyces sp. NPDC058279 TaxID=3346418 RepID=UPI0036EC355A